MTDMLMVGVAAMILLRGATSGQDAHAAFLRGAERGMRSAASLLPALCGMLLMLRLMESSGLMRMVTSVLSPVLARAGIPGEAAPVLLFRPLTGSGSLAALEAVIRQCGVDSRAARISAVLIGSSETIFYTLTVYASAAGVKRVRGAMPASLIGYAAGALVCAVMVR